MQKKICIFMFLIIFIVIFHMIIIMYWVLTTKYNTEQTDLYKIVDNNRDLSESNKTKKNIPWYFKDGIIKPTKSKVTPRVVWPNKQSGDRVEEQLMFVPPNYQYDDAPLKTILLYNEHIKWKVKDGQSEFVSNCPVNRCTITTNKLDAPYVDAIIFRDQYVKPVHKKPDKQIWILFVLQSAYNTRLKTEDSVINWMATYRHDSDIVIPYARWAYYDPLVTQSKTFKTNDFSYKTKQVAFFASNCDSSNNNKLLYVNELKKYIQVDVYGNCGEYNTINENFFLKLLDVDYKFYLAFEDSNCVDYVTNIFFVNGLQHNVLPIVMGGRREDYKRIAPERSYVHVDDFESPEMLANYLHKLDENNEMYNEYFQWKDTGEFVDTKFFCRLCAMLHDVEAPNQFYKNVDDWWSKRGTCDESKPVMFIMSEKSKEEYEYMFKENSIDFTYEYYSEERSVVPYESY